MQQGQKAHVINLYMWRAMENARTFFVEEVVAHVVTFKERICLACLDAFGVDLFYLDLFLATVALGIDRSL